jgi:hypothetical protein
MPTFDDFIPFVSEFIRVFWWSPCCSLCLCCPFMCLYICVNKDESIKINVREYRRINQKWIILRHRQHRAHNTKKKKRKTSEFIRVFWWSPCCSLCLCCPIMCLYVLSSVLWCPLRFPHKNGVLFVFSITPLVSSNVTYIWNKLYVAIETILFPYLF